MNNDRYVITTCKPIPKCIPILQIVGFFLYFHFYGFG